MGIKRCFGCMELKQNEGACPVCGYDHEIEPESPQHLKPGTILQGKYLLGRVLGHGGFGITYLAWDINLDIRLAVKEYMPREFAARHAGKTIISIYSGEMARHFDYGLRRFLDEAKTLAQFSHHPGIVAVRDFFKENGTAYIVMNYLDGADLKHYLASAGGKIPYETAMQILLPVMDALREVHSKGTLHRDISPDNIYLTSEGQVKVLDFGAARHAMTEFSQSISVILKPGYAPEEQYRSKGKQGPWTDVYAVAATMYRAITGEIPPESLDRLEEDTLQKPSELGVSIPVNSERALMKALSVRAADRYQSIAEFQQALLSDFEIDTSPPSQETQYQSNTQHVPEFEGSKKNDRPKPAGEKKKSLPKWVWFAGGSGVIICLCLAFLFIFYFIGLMSEGTKEPDRPPNDREEKVIQKARVPNVSGLTLPEAEKALKQAGFRVSTKNLSSYVVDKGMVMDQSIKANTRAEKGKLIVLEVSGGWPLPEEWLSSQPKDLTIVEKYWNEAYELAEKQDLEGALQLYTNARDMAAELVALNNDPHAQYYQGVLERDIGTVKSELGYFYYGLQNSMASVYLLDDLMVNQKMYTDSISELAISYGTLSYDQLLNGFVQEAIHSAEKGLETDTSQKWILLNLAHAYLFNNQFEEAQNIYIGYQNEVVTEDGKTLKDYALQDFAYFKSIQFTHPDMQKIEEQYQ